MADKPPGSISDVPRKAGPETGTKPEPTDPHGIGAKVSAMHRAGVQPESKTPKDTAQDIIKWVQDHPIFSEEPQERLDNLANLNGASLAALITSVHSLVAPTTPATPHPDVVKAGDKPMLSPEQRLEYLDKAAELIKQVAQLEAKTEEERTRALARIADVVGLATVITHSFLDGNGRTSRTLALLLKARPSDYPEDLPIVTANRPIKLDQVRISGYIPRVFTTERDPIGTTPEEEWEAVHVAAGLGFDLTDQGQAEYNKKTLQTYVSPLIRAA